MIISPRSLRLKKQKNRFRNPIFIGFTRVMRLDTIWGKSPALFNGGCSWVILTIYMCNSNNFMIRTCLIQTNIYQIAKEERDLNTWLRGLTFENICTKSSTRKKYCRIPVNKELLTGTRSLPILNYWQWQSLSVRNYWQGWPLLMASLSF